jgi:ATP-dependent Lhr-like helicase
MACPETLPAGNVEVPLDHPIVRQTLEDCLTEAMDVDGFLEVLRRLRDGSIRRRAVDTPEPSVFAHGILAAQPYAFLDDAPLEERRTQAVLARRTSNTAAADELGALDPDAIRRVREEAWPSPASAEEVHEALLWMGFVTVAEAREWEPWLLSLRASGRAVLEGDRWFSAEASRDPKTVLRGRLEALGPIVSEDPLLLELEAEGTVLRGRFEGRSGWCNRRLLARIHRYTLERLRKEIEPVTAAEFLRFLAAHQHVDEEHRLDGPRGVAEIVRQLAGFELPAAAWEASVLPARVRNYKRDWLDQLTLSGEVAWGRLWGSGVSAIRTTPLCLLPREDLEAWTALARPFEAKNLTAPAAPLYEVLRDRGAVFPQDLKRRSGLSATDFDEGLGLLVAAGIASCDQFGALRALVAPSSRRWLRDSTSGRWSFFRHPTSDPPPAAEIPADSATEMVARQLLLRTGIVFRKTIAREKLPVAWRDLLRVYRTLEARGEVRGGRFVAGFDGEQYAFPAAVTLLRSVRRRGAGSPIHVSAADPLNFRGILTPDERVAPTTRRLVQLA